jgi:hypothetical protein
MWEETLEQGSALLSLKVGHTLFTQRCLDCIADLVQRINHTAGMIVHRDEGSMIANYPGNHCLYRSSKKKPTNRECVPALI